MPRPVRGATVRLRAVAALAPMLVVTTMSVVMAPSAAALVSAPTLTGQASADTTLGHSISDSVTVSGLVDPQNGVGTITFTVYGPVTTSSCPPAPSISSSSAGPVNADQTYTSASFTPTVAGTYEYIATYSGDGQNASASTACGAASQEVTVTGNAQTLATTTLTASAPATAPSGDYFDDTAVLSGGTSPTGTITFDLYASGSGAPCTAALLETDTVKVHGNGTYESGRYHYASGTYYWGATYSGDDNNAGAGTVCGSTNQTVTITKDMPTITGTISATTTAGGPLTDTATLAGGSAESAADVAPTGVITFSLYGPNNSTCSGTPVFTSTATVTADDTYKSGSFTPKAAGTYIFIAAYGGNARNAAVSTPCNDSSQLATITAVASTSTTTTLDVPSTGLTYGLEGAAPLSVSVTQAGGVTPTGSVAVLNNANDQTLCTITLSSGEGSCSLSATQLAAGTHQLTASYAGTASSPASLSPTADLVVRTARTSTTLSLFPRTVTYGHENAEEFSVIVSNAGSREASGRAYVDSAGMILCVAHVNDGKGSCRPGRRKMAAGGHEIKVAFHPNSNSFSRSSSSRHRLTVKKA